MEGERKRMSLGKALRMSLADGSMACLWIIANGSLGVGASILGEYLNWEGDRTPIVYALVFVVNILFVEASINLGGAAWNPTGPLAFYAAGYGEDTLVSLALRMPAMAVGAAAGVFAVTEFMPSSHRHLVGSGPQLKVDVYTGAIAEGLLTFAINLVVLYVVLRATSNRFLQTPLIVACALVLVQQGAQYTGPALNPSDAFGWAYLNSNHTSAEHMYVYWLTPFIGTLAAAFVYRTVFGGPAPKAKSA